MDHQELFGYHPDFKVNHPLSERRFLECFLPTVSEPEEYHHIATGILSYNQENRGTDAYENARLVTEIECIVALVSPTIEEVEKLVSQKFGNSRVYIDSIKYKRYVQMFKVKYSDEFRGPLEYVIEWGRKIQIPHKWNEATHILENTLCFYYECWKNEIRMENLVASLTNAKPLNEKLEVAPTYTVRDSKGRFVKHN